MSHNYFKPVALRFVYHLIFIITINSSTVIYSQTPEEITAQPSPESMAPKTEFETLLNQELDNIDSPDSEKKKEPTSWFSQILKTTFILAIMIFAFYAFYRIKIFRKQFLSKNSEIIKLLHNQQISPGKSMHIIELGNKLMLLGSSENGISLITEFHEKQVIDQIKLDCQREITEEKPDFWIETGKIVSDKIKSFFTKNHSNDSFYENKIKYNSQELLARLKNGRDKLNDNDEI